MSAAGALLNEGIRSGYSPMEVFDHQLDSLGLSNCLIPFNYNEVYNDDALISDYDNDDCKHLGYPLMELLDQHSVSPSDDSFLDFDFDSVLFQDPDTNTFAEGVSTAHPNPADNCSPMTAAAASPSPSPFYPLSSSFMSSPDIYEFLDREVDEEEEEEEERFLSSHEEALRNIPIFVASGRVSEEEEEDDDCARKSISRLSTRFKVENNHSSASKYVVPRSVTEVIDTTTVTIAPRRVRRRKAQLWYFLLEILGDPEYNPHYIQWENKDLGIFRFIESKKVAQLWGAKKKRSGMSYEYFARAMRHYYSRGIMRRVTGRRLVYQFGPKAENWKGYAQQVTIGQATEDNPSNNSNNNDNNSC